MAVLVMVLVMLMMVMIIMLVKLISVTMAMTMVISDENRQPKMDITFPQDHTTGQTLRLQETLEASDGAAQSQMPHPKRAPQIPLND